MSEPNFVLASAVEDSRSSLDRILERIRNALNLSDYDINVIRNVNQTLKEPTPSVQLSIQNRVSKLDAMRMDLLDLIFDVGVQKNDLEYKYKERYDDTFAKLVRADRPSQQAIDSEIHAMDPAMRDMRMTLNNYELLRSLLFGYLKSLDKSRETCMKLWGTY